MTSKPELVLLDTTFYCKEQGRAISLLRQFHGMCAKEFDPNELESVADWEASLQPQGRGAGNNELFRGVYVLLVGKAANESEGQRQEAETVLGGITLEVYPQQKLCLLAYVVVSSACRGQGLSRVLVEYCREWARVNFPAAESNDSGDLKPLIVIEVLQVRDAPEPKKAAAATRQQVWAKMGFKPIVGVDLVHPGKLKGGRYNIAVNPAANDSASGGDVAVSFTQLKSWLKLFFRLILEDGDDEDESEAGSNAAEEEEEDEQQQEKQSDQQKAKQHAETANVLVEGLGLPSVLVARPGAWL